MTEPGDNLERLVEVFKIIERRSGAVYRTKSLGERWVGLNDRSPADFIYTPISTGRAKELLDQGKMTIRRKS